MVDCTRVLKQFLVFSRLSKELLDDISAVSSLLLKASTSLTLNMCFLSESGIDYYFDERTHAAWGKQLPVNLTYLKSFLVYCRNLSCLYRVLHTKLPWASGNKKRSSPFTLYERAKFKSRLWRCCATLVISTNTDITKTEKMLHTWPWPVQ